MRPRATHGVVYGVRCKLDGRYCYIGQTRGPLAERWRGHKKGNTPFSHAVQLLGDDAFDVEVIERVPVAMLNEREEHWIAHYETLSPRGMNRIVGGRSSARSATTVKRMGEARRKLWADPEYKAKMRKALAKAWADDPDRRARQAELMAANPPPKRERKPKPKRRTRSEAARAKILTPELRAAYSAAANRRWAAARAPQGIFA